MDLLATLLLGHLIADFPLQMNWLFRLKTYHWAGILLHAAIHGLVTAMLLQNPLIHWPMLVTLWGIHFITDWLKLNIDFKFQSFGFILDQIAHAAVLILLANWPFQQITGILPPVLLYPALLYALLPAMLTFLATLALDLEESSNLFHWLKNRAPKLILLSQWVGSPLVLLLMIVRLGR